MCLVLLDLVLVVELTEFETLDVAVSCVISVASSVPVSVEATDAIEEEDFDFIP